MIVVKIATSFLE